MTDPKEEAKRIVEMFTTIKESRWVDDAHGGTIEYENLSDDCAKQCALLHVDGILIALNHKNVAYADDAKKYYTAVKEELDKM